MDIEVEEKYPLKQGLKQSSASSSEIGHGVEEKYPLKQGLKLRKPADRPAAIIVEEKYPLKQGLKLHRGAAFGYILWLRRNIH